MVSIAVIKVENFREWTHGVNENEILFVQHSIYSFFTQKLGNIGAFIFPAFYDNFICVVNTVNSTEFIKIINEAINKFHFKFSVSFSTNNSAYECLELKSLKKIKAAKDQFSSDPITVLHFDIDSYLKKSDNLYNISNYITEILNEIRSTFSDQVGYLVSGDNYVFVGSDISYDEIRNKFLLISQKYPLKLGIGVSRYPGRAATLSAIALDEIRAIRGKKDAYLEIEKKINIKYDENVSVYLNEIDVFEKSKVMNYLLQPFNYTS